MQVRGATPSSSFRSKGRCFHALEECGLQGLAPVLLGDEVQSEIQLDFISTEPQSGRWLLRQRRQLVSNMVEEQRVILQCCSQSDRSLFRGDDCASHDQPAAKAVDSKALYPRESSRDPAAGAQPAQVLQSSG